MPDTCLLQTGIVAKFHNSEKVKTTSTLTEEPKRTLVASRYPVPLA